MNTFVGYKEKPLSVPELLIVINELKTDNTHYFLRCTHEVSGIQTLKKKPITEDKFPMLEGQIFNHEFELRWKHKRNNTYEVLLLTTGENHDNFQQLGQDWQIEERKAHFYQSTETRFPKGFDYPDNLHIKQRYFLDKITATVHFISLTVEK
ncbi:hypothetical protein A0J48_005095 [Sphaerospermopsis aphanizomenoides BCCUSP55]|uniref:hypothetical protein n=1 Tax=Sphaerospermopsis aphanizomenoides TaxID=459663 RepID=UPI001903AD8A|nr:hypothetical protein [Sphaerospermopsis aphanizomenoides]MBK1986925.1 hypothetical protein [Sphaerospermopsis aphanizomenoides BCCUSP55]